MASPCQSESTASKWLINLIRAVWQYSKTIWSFYNSAVHGTLPTFTLGKVILQLREEAEAAYHRLENDPHIIPQACRYLFHRPLETIQEMGEDSLRCWLAFVHEAELTAGQ
jgi:hypothetical protein